MNAMIAEDLAMMRNVWEQVQRDANIGKMQTLVDNGKACAELATTSENMASFWALCLEYTRAAFAVRFVEGEPAEPAPAPEVSSDAAPLAPGFYTVEFPEGDYVTLRVQPDFRADAPEDSRVIGYLAGPENTSDYVGFAFVLKGRVQTWGRFRGKLARQHAALAVLLGSEDAAEQREAYARVSGRCARCGKVLTVPASLNRGLGPECAKKLGM